MDKLMKEKLTDGQINDGKMGTDGQINNGKIDRWTN